MSKKSLSGPILMADDDEDDRMMTQDAWELTPYLVQLRFVEDGEELMDYLHRRGKYRGRDLAPRPAIVLLDLNMPKKDGHEALSEIKSDPNLRQIPVVVLTTSRAKKDIKRSYGSGANSYVTKPTGFESLVKTMKALGRYWFEVAKLPSA